MILPFHTVRGVLKARILKWFAIPFSSGPHSQTSPPWSSHLGWPHMAWLSFIELDKDVVHVIRLASFLWLWFQCVCPLMPSCNTYRLTWVSLTLDVGYLFTGAPESAAAAPYLGQGVSPHSRPSWPWRWSNFSRPSCAQAATAPWTWASSSLLPPWPQAWGSSSTQLPWPRAWGSSSRPPPWPRTWDSSSRPLLCRRSLALSVVAPDLGQGVAPLSHAFAQSIAASMHIK